MQVSPDKNVRVTETSPIGRIPVSPEHAAGLQHGDFLVATVEQIHGDMLLLRVDGGFLLNAALQGNMQLAQGDVIEAAVSKDGGTCLLYIVNVLHPGNRTAKDTADSVSPQTLSAMLTVIKRNPGLDADIALYLAENHIPDTPENIAALTQMSRGTGIGALLGRILGLTAQGPQTTPTGNVPPPAMMGPGEAAPPPQGETVYTEGMNQGGQAPSNPIPQAPNQAPVNGSTPQPATPEGGQQGADAGPGAPPASPDAPHNQPAAAAPAQTPGMGPETGNAAPMPPAQTDGPAGSQAAGGGKTPEAQTGPLPGAAGTAQPQAQPRADTAGTVPPDQPQGAQQDTGAGPRAPGMAAQHIAPDMEGRPGLYGDASQTRHGEETAPAPMALGDTAAQAGGGKPGVAQELDGGIGKLIMGLFYEPEEQTGDGIKRMAEGMSRGLKTLKSDLIQTDNKYRELCLKSVDQALRQMEMADRAAYFEHMQIPLALKEGEHRTAELYVFRRQGGKKSPAEAGLTILVALDTERMGRVETLIRETGGSIALEFRLEQPGMTDRLRQNSAPLQEAVEAAGYRLTGMRFAGLEKKTTVLNAGEMASPAAGEAPHGIDVQI